MDWTKMTPKAFDTKAADVQEALFAAPDACGTADLFEESDTLF